MGRILGYTAANTELHQHHGEPWVGRGEPGKLSRATGLGAHEGFHFYLYESNICTIILNFTTDYVHVYNQLKTPPNHLFCPSKSGVPNQSIAVYW